jgi:hypothetical protein
MLIVAKGSGKPSHGVGAARLHQRTGTSNSFGGYTKVRRIDGSFTMRKTSPSPSGVGGGASSAASPSGGTTSIGGGSGSVLDRAVSDLVVRATDSFVKKYDPENHDPTYAATHGQWTNLVRAIEGVSAGLGDATTVLLDLPTTSIGDPACWLRGDSRSRGSQHAIKSRLMIIDLHARTGDPIRSSFYDGEAFRPHFPADLLRLPDLVALRSRCGQACAELDSTRLWLEAVTDAGENADLLARVEEEMGVWMPCAAEALPALDAALSTAARAVTEDGLQTLPQQLAQLAELHDVGALSDEEFAQAKSHVLAGHAQP